MIVFRIGQFGVFAPSTSILQAGACLADGPGIEDQPGAAEHVPGKFFGLGPFQNVAVFLPDVPLGNVKGLGGVQADGSGLGQGGVGQSTMRVEARSISGGQQVNTGEGMAIGNLHAHFAVLDRQIRDLQGTGPVVLEYAVGGGDETEASLARRHADSYAFAGLLEEKLVVARSESFQGEESVLMGGSVSKVGNVKPRFSFEQRALFPLLSLSPGSGHGQLDLLPG